MVNWSSTQWLFHALFPIPLAFVFLLLPVSKWTLAGATALIGLISGFVFSTATSLTSELFGPNSAGINHAILVTNVPLGSWFYGQMAALNYEANIHNSKVCIGRECYNLTFIWWLGISFIGVVTSYLLYCRTTTTAYHLLQGLPWKTERFFLLLRSIAIFCITTTSSTNVKTKARWNSNKEEARKILDIVRLGRGNRIVNLKDYDYFVLLILKACMKCNKTDYTKSCKLSLSKHSPETKWPTLSQSWSVRPEYRPHHGPCPDRVFLQFG